jgi:hypothetical protein
MKYLLILLLTLESVCTAQTSLGLKRAEVKHEWKQTSFELDSAYNFAETKILSYSSCGTIVKLVFKDNLCIEEIWSYPFNETAIVTEGLDSMYPNFGDYWEGINRKNQCYLISVFGMGERMLILYSFKGVCG